MSQSQTIFEKKYDILDLTSFAAWMLHKANAEDQSADSNDIAAWESDPQGKASSDESKELSQKFMDEHKK